MGHPVPISPSLCLSPSLDSCLPPPLAQPPRAPSPGTCSPMAALPEHPISPSPLGLHTSHSPITLFLQLPQPKGILSLDIQTPMCPRLQGSPPLRHTVPSLPCLQIQGSPTQTPRNNSRSWTLGVPLLRDPEPQLPRNPPPPPNKCPPPWAAVGGVGTLTRMSLDSLGLVLEKDCPKQR